MDDFFNSFALSMCHGRLGSGWDAFKTDKFQKYEAVGIDIVLLRFRKQVTHLRNVLEALHAKGKERQWLKHQVNILLINGILYLIQSTMTDGVNSFEFNVQRKFALTNSKGLAGHFHLLLTDMYICVLASESYWKESVKEF